MPPPPMPGAPSPPLGRGLHQSIEREFEAIALTPPNMPGNVPSTPWKTEDYVDIEALASTISHLFGTPKQPIVIMDVSQRALFEEIRAVPGNQSMQFDKENLNVNPAAWTSPEGIIYMGVDAPDYSENGQLDADKIRSTIIHESLHYSSLEHVGFQASTDVSVANSNYDEYVTDYFARQVFNKMFPGAAYKTGYFTKDLNNNFMRWGGNMAKFMIDSGHVTSAELTVGYFRTGKLKPLPESLLSKWKMFAKQNRRPLKM